MHRALDVLLRHRRRRCPRFRPGCRRSRQTLNSWGRDSSLASSGPTHGATAASAVPVRAKLDRLPPNRRQPTGGPHPAPFLILIFRVPLTKFAPAPSCARLTRPFSPSSFHESEVVWHGSAHTRRDLAAQCFQLRGPTGTD